VCVCVCVCDEEYTLMTFSVRTLNILFTFFPSIGFSFQNVQSGDNNTEV